MELEQILNYQNLVVIIAIMGVIEVLKKILEAFKVMDSKPVSIILPLLPVVFGAVAGVIPSVITGPTVAFRMTIGIALGGLGGQVWKIVHTKLQLLEGKL